MGYRLFAFVALKGTFDEIKSRSPYITVKTLNQRFDLMLNDWHLEAVLPQPINRSKIAEFEHSLLNQSLVDLCLEFSERQGIAYILADFAGGTGLQFGVAWKNRQIIALPENNNVIGRIPGRNGPINTVLRAIGVQVAETDDEFVALGLLKHRDMEDWFIAATGFDRNVYDPDES